jgi:hypothetical protein
MVGKLSTEILELIIDYIAVDNQDIEELRFTTESNSTLEAWALSSSFLRLRAHHHFFAVVMIMERKHSGALQGKEYYEDRQSHRDLSRHRSSTRTTKSSENRGCSVPRP